MLDPNFWLELGKSWGLPIAVLAAWYVHNREQNKLWGEMLQSNREQTAEMIKLNGEQAKQTLESYKAQAGQMMESYKTQAGQMMDNTNKIWSTVTEMIRQQLIQQNDVLKGLLENDNYQGAQLSRMENKIDTNQSCPLVRKEQHK